MFRPRVRSIIERLVDVSAVFRCFELICQLFFRLLGCVLRVADSRDAGFPDRDGFAYVAALA